MKTKVKRLYEQFKPSEYNLDITIDEASMKFNGTVSIKGVKTGRPSRRMTFHQKGLKITRAEIVHIDKKGTYHKELSRHNTHASFEELRLHTAAQLYPGIYKVTIDFEGSITRTMNGIYPCNYEEDGQQKQCIVTQFESHHAREVFPCIDEPEAKAVFKLTLRTRPTTVLSNTPVISQTHQNDQITTVFEPSPVMSTYLLAFVIGDLAYKEATTSRGVAVRTYSTPANSNFTDFALKTAVDCIEFYEQYFGIQYPLAKCDLIALPDFASGAMENWGCITFREQCMLVDPQNTALPTKQYVAMVVAHELAHMWFGNLVTMRWWTDLWLNEGFASWIEYLAVDALFPDWHMWVQFIVDEQQHAMKLDSLDNTHPIEVPVNHPDEIRSIFDAISYAKGASVIHQLQAYLGAETFRKGLHNYLKQYAYKNATTEDLWESLAAASGKDVKKFMHGWTSRPGYPIVHVSKSGSTTLELRQKRFYINPPDQVTHDYAWHIPLLDNRMGEMAVMASANKTLVLTKNEPLLLNKNRGGFYRVHYEDTLLEQLAVLVEKNKLDPLDRMGLIADLFEASKAGDVSTVSVLRFVKHYSGETDVTVWTVLSSIISTVRTVFGTDELRSLIKPFVVALARDEYKRLGWEKHQDDTHFDLLLRPMIIGLMSSADDAQVLRRCQRLFEQTVEGKAIDPDMRTVVMTTVARHGDEETYEKLLSLYRKTSLSEEKMTYAAALTNFRQEHLIDKALAMIKTDEVRMQDIGYWIAYGFANHYSRRQMWEWLKTNWLWLEKHIGTDLSFYQIPLYVARVHSESDFIADYQNFFSSKLTPAIDRSYRQGLEMLEWHVTWRQRDQEAIIAYLNLSSK